MTCSTTRWRNRAYMMMAATTDCERARPAGAAAAARGRSGRKVDMQYQIVADGRVIQRTGGAPAAALRAPVSTTSMALPTSR